MVRFGGEKFRPIPSLVDIAAHFSSVFVWFKCCNAGLEPF
jgi:hypothetical protein